MSATIDLAVADEIARRCGLHLALEDAFWAEAQPVLKAVEQGLKAGQWQTLAQLASAQVQLAEASARLQLTRARLIKELAGLLGEPADGLTISAIAGRLPVPQAARLVGERNRARTRLVERQRLVKGCSVLARIHLDFIEGFFAELTGTSGGGRYGPEGTLRPTACRPLLQARG